MRSSPQHSRCIHQITIGLKADRKPAVFLVRERRTDRRWCAIADAAATGMSRPLIRLIEVPQPARPRSRFAVVVRHKGPIFILDLRPQLGGNTRCADWTRVPRICRRLPHALSSCATGVGELRASVLEYATSIARD